VFFLLRGISFQGKHTFFQQKKHEGAAPSKLKRIIPKKGEDKKVKVPFLWGGEMGSTSFFGPTKQSNKSGLAFLLSHSWNGLLLKGTYRIPQNFT